MKQYLVEEHGTHSPPTRLWFVWVGPGLRNYVLERVEYHTGDVVYYHSGKFHYIKDAHGTVWW